MLRACTSTLTGTECAIIETVFFNDGGNNSFHCVVDFMRERGFCVYDIVEPVYRPMDMALWQADVVFVKCDGSFRRFQNYGDEAAMTALAKQ